MVTLPEKHQVDIKLSSLEWIIGNWHTKTENGTMEEYWYPVLGDAMAGWFRWKKDDAIFLYEFMLFQEIEKHVVLKIKHFDANLEGWEENHAWIHYEAWISEPNKVIFKAAAPEHTPWLIYEKIDSKLTAAFYDLSGNLNDKFEFSRIA